jgi:hypothetical protein
VHPQPRHAAPVRISGRRRAAFGHRRFGLARRSINGAALVAENREDLGVRRQEQGGLVVQELLVSLQGALELVERRVSLERVGVDAHRLGFACRLGARRLGISLGGDPGLLPVGLGDHALGVALAFGAELLGDLAALGLHALEHALLVRLRQVQLTDIELDHLDAEGRQRIRLDRVAHLADQRREAALVLGGGDERRERIIAERGTDLGEHHVGQLELGAGAGAHGLQKAPGIGDPPERKAAHHHVLLVGGEVFGLSRLGVEQPAVDRQHPIEWQLEVQARRVHHPHDVAEPADHAVAGDVEREQRAIDRRDQQRSGQQQEQAARRRSAGDRRPWRGRRPHLRAPPSGSSSHRSKSLRSSAPGRMNFCTPGITASSASSCRRKRVNSGARR